MDKEETKYIAEIIVSISLLTGSLDALHQSIAKVLDELHKSLTKLIIQKGEPNAKNPNDFDVNRN